MLPPIIIDNAAQVIGRGGGQVRQQIVDVAVNASAAVARLAGE